MKRDSSNGFFNSGMTTASFKQSGKIPDSNELLIMLVITEISDSLQDFSKCVGIQDITPIIRDITLVKLFA